MYCGSIECLTCECLCILLVPLLTLLVPLLPLLANVPLGVVEFNEFLEVMSAVKEIKAKSRLARLLASDPAEWEHPRDADRADTSTMDTPAGDAPEKTSTKDNVN